MTTVFDRSPLGRATDYPDRYDPALLFPIERAAQREAIGLSGALPFRGVDLWTAYEISWLDARGKPQPAIGRLAVPADSPAIVESKSLKLYLGSFAQERLPGIDALERRIGDDLERACGAAVHVELTPAARFEELALEELPGESLDGLDVAFNAYEPAPELLRSGGAETEETLRSALFRSNCPVTGQPDYADVMVHYRGPRVDRTGLFRYLVSYRKYAAFHETCVERIFVEVLERCRPSALTVHARFLRRGGIDINPFRSNFESASAATARTSRQ
ncbi:MAG TPA: NADPH-dependent 7-cyano-7-deazaguanine reductase QueF [Casimicrobiaceae bacterium]|nr:NADPH-dependent 7-cyano-7-deazaguanine reductase QueF [Casimicrobiaceae bacterium]